MGILDNASRRFTRAGEETVRVVDYDDVPAEEIEEKEPKERKVKEAKAPREPKPAREPKVPRERKKLNLAAAAKGLIPHKDDSVERYDDGEENGLEDDDFISMDAEAESKRRFPVASTAFEIDEEEPDFYEEKEKLWAAKNQASTDELLADSGAIQDILDVLKIPATFTIPEDILMPEDFDNIDFDIQVPQGYDQGQVQFFKERAESTVREYLKLLEARNEHIATLATTIDRLQVDANNLKYDNQIAAGIGIIPTSDSVDLENENMELKLQLKKLRDAAKTSLNSEERELYEEMRNQLALLTRDKEDLEDKNYELRNIVANYEENGEEMVTSPSGHTDHESAEIVFQNMDDDEEDGLPNMGEFIEYDDDSAGLPAIGEALPEFSSPDPVATPPKASNSSFDIPEDDVEDFLNSVTTDSPSSSNSSDSEDDDELDRLMRDWKN